MIGIAKQFVALPIVDHLLIGIVLVFDLVAAPRLGMWAYSLFSLPGTAAHEFLRTSKYVIDNTVM